jgi:LacI family transcriptional regulator
MDTASSAYLTILLKEVLNMEMLANGSIDGFIMSLSKETQFKVIFIIFRIDQGMPVVMFDEY